MRDRGSGRLAQALGTISGMNVRSVILFGICTFGGLVLGSWSGVLILKHLGSSRGIAVNLSPSDSRLLEEIQGLWQLPDHPVWIKVSPDGTVLECRSNRGVFVVLGKATFQSGGVLAWDVPQWGKETISLSEGSLLLSHADGASAYARPTRLPGEDCGPKLGL